MANKHTGPEFIRQNGNAGCDHEWSLVHVGAPCGCCVDACVKADCEAKRHRPLIARSA